MRSLPLLLLVLALPAQAFAPSDTTGAPHERARGFTAAGQVQARHSAAWQQFLAGEGAGWQARFDESTLAPLRAYGPPIALGTVTTEAQAIAAARSFLTRHPELAGVDAKSLDRATARYGAERDAWYVDLLPSVGRTPVERSAVTFRIQDGRLVLFGSNVPALPQAVPVPTVSPQDAVSIVLSEGPALGVPHDNVQVDQVLLPDVTADGFVARPAWRVDSSTSQPRGEWSTWIDSQTGELLAIANGVHFFDGAVLAEHDARTVNGETTVSALPYLRLLSDPTRFADQDGAFSVEGATELDADLRGQYFRVRNDSGTDASFSVSEGEQTITSAEADIAQLDAYVFAHQVREWGQRAAPEVDQGVLNVYVNIDDNCNAYYDGSLNFFRAGQGCNNTARVADIVYHEWGHGFHGESLLAGTWDGSMGEGIGDTVAFLQTGDPVIGPYFETNGRGVRNVEPDRVYPDDYTPSADYVHSNGLIFGSAMWDLWGRLTDEQGGEAGTLATERVFTGLIKGGPTLETVFEEALFADDDDGDLSNGTPNQCALIDIFNKHGLVGVRGDGPLSAQHLAPTLLADQPLELSIDLVNSAPECLNFTPQSGTVSYRVDGGEWAEAELQISGNQATGTLPAQPIGSFVEYYFSVTGSEGGRLENPQNGYIHPFSAYVGDVLPVWFSDFEADDGGFSSELVSGDDVEGADDWQWSAPGGRGGDPTEAASGAKNWGNDQSPDEAWNGEYQDNRFNRLNSPVFDTRHYQGVFLDYSRWLTVEDGVFDQARITADGDTVWSNYATTTQTGTDHHVDTQWQRHAVDLGSRGDDGSLQLAWEIESDGGLTFGGWNVDDVGLFAPNTPDNRLGIADLVASPSEDGRSTVLTWTMPLHAPVTEVVLVRTRGELPTGPEDGEVLATFTDIELGGAMEFIDERPGRKRTRGYALYPSDGDNTLSWTREGYNAALMRLADTEAGAGGCACSSSGGAVGSLWVLGLGGLLVRRRRRA